MREHDESTLPKWAQRLIADLRQDVRLMQASQQAVAVTRDKDWFTIRGPAFDHEEDVRYLCCPPGERAYRDAVESEGAVFCRLGGECTRPASGGEGRREE